MDKGGTFLETLLRCVGRGYYQINLVLPSELIM